MYAAELQGLFLRLSPQVCPWRYPFSVFASVVVFWSCGFLLCCGDPLPEYACFDSGTLLDIAEEVDGTSVTSQACVILSNMTRRLKNDTDGPREKGVKRHFPARGAELTALTQEQAEFTCSLDSYIERSRSLNTSFLCASAVPIFVHVPARVCVRTRQGLHFRSQGFRSSHVDYSVWDAFLLSFVLALVVLATIGKPVLPCFTDAATLVVDYSGICMAGFARDAALRAVFSEFMMRSSLERVVTQRFHCTVRLPTRVAMYRITRDMIHDPSFVSKKNV